MRKMDLSTGETARRIGICVGLILIGCVAALPTRAQTPPTAPPIAPDANSDRWPMHLDTPSGQITIYQPQLTNFDGDKLTARAAVSVIPPGQQDPVFGALWMESRVATDRVARTVQILDVTVTKVRFPDATGPTEQSLTDALHNTLPQQPMTMSLDQLLSMVQVVQKEKEATHEISNDVPQVLFRDHASILVRFDGDPRLEQVPNSNLLHAVNTPFLVALDPQSRTYFLKGGGQWFSAQQALGPYQNVANPAAVPPQLEQLADSLGYKDPEQALSPAQAAGIEIVTTTVPAELIWTDGPEQMSTLDNTDLLYVANTDCDIFLQIDTQTIYILVSGRWFSAPHRTGPWTFVPPDKLPDDFQRISPDSAKGDVLAHVANTQQAKDAVADTFVPQTAAINKQNFEQPDVEYDGDPQFQPVENTTFSYCVNTPDSVLLVDNQYYCCHSAVWYRCGNPRGPWALCDHVPEVIYTIPPSCPDYSCRYCYVYDSTPDILYCGYLPGYVGCYHYDGVVVYGTGFYYHPGTGTTTIPARSPTDLTPITTPIEITGASPSAWRLAAAMRGLDSAMTEGRGTMTGSDMADIGHRSFAMTATSISIAPTFTTPTSTTIAPTSITPSTTYTTAARTFAMTPTPARNSARPVELGSAVMYTRGRGRMIMRRLREAWIPGITSIAIQRVTFIARRWMVGRSAKTISGHRTLRRMKTTRLNRRMDRTSRKRRKITTRRATPPANHMKPRTQRPRRRPSRIAAIWTGISAQGKKARNDHAKQRLVKRTVEEARMIRVVRIRAIRIRAIRTAARIRTVVAAAAVAAVALHLEMAIRTDIRA